MENEKKTNDIVAGQDDTLADHDGKINDLYSKNSTTDTRVDKIEETLDDVVNNQLKKLDDVKTVCETTQRDVETLSADVKNLDKTVQIGFLLVLALLAALLVLNAVTLARTLRTEKKAQELKEQSKELEKSFSSLNDSFFSLEQTVSSLQKTLEGQISTLTTRLQEAPPPSNAPGVKKGNVVPGVNTGSAPKPPTPPPPVPADPVAKLVNDQIARQAQNWAANVAGQVGYHCSVSKRTIIGFAADPRFPLDIQSAGVATEHFAIVNGDVASIYPQKTAPGALRSKLFTCRAPTFSHVSRPAKACRDAGGNWVLQSKGELR